MAKLFGFTILRNGVKYDYSFVESIQSLGGVTQKVVVALGDSEDNTEELVRKIPNVEIVPTIWDQKLRDGGLILSQQTNVALNHLKDQNLGEDSWGIYLQCDEVIHSDDYQLIKEDIEKASKMGCDAVTFRYLHFWQSHHQLAINKKWYPQEIRAVKLNTAIESWGDAQSFRNFHKVYESEARVFHYGHVREEGKYLLKKRDILKLYHLDDRIKKYKKREKRFDGQTICLPYWGPHPAVMKERIERLEGDWKAEKVDRVYIVGPKEQLENGFEKRIRGREVIWCKSIREVPFKDLSKVVYIRPRWWNWPKAIFGPKTPRKMRSKLARPWELEFYLTLQLSRLGIGVD